MKRELCVVDLETQEVVHRVDVSTKNDREVERIERGLLMKTNTEKYYVDDRTTQ